MGWLSKPTLHKVYYFSFFSSLVCVFPYVNLYFKAIGLSERQIGVLAATKPWVAAVASNALSSIADRHACHRALFVFGFVASTLLRCSLLLAHSFAAAAAVVVALCVMGDPLMVLADTAVVAAAENEDDYGKQRLWGGVGWGALSPVAGAAVQRYGMGAAFAMYGAGALLNLPSALLLDFGAVNQSGGSASGGGGGGGSGSGGGGSSGGGGGGNGSRRKSSDSAHGRAERGEEGDKEEEEEGRPLLQMEMADRRAAPIDKHRPRSRGGRSIDGGAGAVRLSTPPHSCSKTQVGGGAAGSGQQRGGTPNAAADPAAVAAAVAAAGTGAKGIDSGIGTGMAAKRGDDEGMWEDGDGCGEGGEGELTEAADKARRAPFSARVRQVLRRPSAAVFFAMALCMGVGMGTIEGWLFLWLAQLGGSELLMGLTLTVTCAAEVPLFHWSGALLRAMGVSRVLHMVLGAFVLRLLIYACLPLMPSPWLVLPAELLHGITFGCAWSAGVWNSRLISPPGLEATTQAVFQSLYFGVGHGAGGLMGGLVYHALGGGAVFIVAAAVVAVGWALCAAAEAYFKRKGDTWG